MPSTVLNYYTLALEVIVKWKEYDFDVSGLLVSKYKMTMWCGNVDWAILGKCNMYNLNKRGSMDLSSLKPLSYSCHFLIENTKS